VDSAEKQLAILKSNDFRKEAVTLCGEHGVKLQ
jgi:hypothetical protein